MGCSLSCMQMQMQIISSPPIKLTSVRIVRLNGLVEDIDYPISVAELTGKQPAHHLLFTQAQLLTAAATPLKMDAPLERGRVYFLLPSTLFQSSVSPMELAPIARKLVSIAQNTPSSKSNSNSITTTNNNLQKSGKWKPILSTIRERSFNRRSESELQAQDAANIHNKD